MEILAKATLNSLRDEMIDNPFSPTGIRMALCSAKIILKRLYEIDDSPLTLRALNGVRDLTYLDDDELVQMALDVA
jgi:hypothetical protein